MNNIPILLILLVFIACNNEPQNEITQTEPQYQNEQLNQLYTNIMTEHDRQMELMQPLQAIKYKMREYVQKDTFQTLPSDQQKEILKQLTQINKAHDNMMQWMYDFEAPTSQEPEATKQILNNYAASLDTVGQNIDDALHQGREIIEKYNL